MKFRHLPFIMLAIVSTVLMVATFVEKARGTEVVTRLVYDSWWFVALWTLLAVVSMAVVLKAMLFRKPVTFLLHMAFIVILAGAMTTWLTGIQGTVHLRMDEPCHSFATSDGKTLDFPFSLTLKSFHIDNYPGTQSAMDFISEVTAETEGSNRSQLIVSMNNIGHFHGYRLYQSGYDDDGLGTTFSVSHDPWGIGITYIGYGLLFLSMLLLLVLPGEGFRRLLRQQKRATALILLFLTTALPLHAAEPKVVPNDVASAFGDLYVYYNGRICPFQTLAKDFTTKLYGKAGYKGYSPEQVLTGWMLYPTDWISQPCIKVKGSVARIIGTHGRYASYNDFHGPEGYKLDPALHAIRSGLQANDARAIREADEKMNILLMVFNGKLVKLFPYAPESQPDQPPTWYAAGEELPSDMPDDQWTFTRKSTDYLAELLWMKHYDDALAAISKIKTFQQKEASGSLPADTLFRAEKLYDKTEHTRLVAMLLLTIGLVAFIIYLRAWVRQKTVSRAVSVTAVMLIVSTLAYQFFIILLRSYVSGHLPLANGYETMQFMTLCALVVTLLLARQFPLAIPFGILIAGLTQLVSMMGQSNPQITPLMPVLASPLLSIHVSIIMLAYVLLAFTFLNGLTSLLLTMGRHTDTHQHMLTTISRLLLYPAVFCLAAGIFVGAIWANQSWGRYWGWDPKEVWALITLLVYSVAFHRESIAWLRRPTAFHLYLVLAFLTILMTYFGVNYFLGGIHSYA